MRQRQKKSSYILKKSPVSVKLGFFVLLCFLLTIAAPSSHAKAEGVVVDVAIEAGYNGQMVYNQDYPLKASLTNQSAEHVKGMLVFSLAYSQGTQGEWQQEVEIPSGTTIEVVFRVPGEQLTKDNNKLTLYPSIDTRSNPIQLRGNTYGSTQMLQGTVIGVFSSHLDTLNFLPSLNLKGYQIAVVPLRQSDVPTSSAMLGMFDAIVLNDVPSNNWAGEQTRALIDWTKAGGTLVLSGGAGYAKTAMGFEELVPLTATGTSNLTEDQLQELTSFANMRLVAEDERILPPVGTITMSTGTMDKGTVVLGTKDQPIAIKHQAGVGNVLYLAFDPSLAPLNTWTGSPVLWSNLLPNVIAPVQGNVNYGGPNLEWMLGNAIEYFPSIKLPGIASVTLTFMLYVIIVAPILYLILRRLDKREWSWWLIPSISLLTALVFLFFGAGDRRNELSHNLRLVELGEDGTAVSHGMYAVLSNTGGVLKLEDRSGYSLDFVLDNYWRGTPGGALSTLTDNVPNEQMRLGTGSTTAMWSNVPYMSFRKVMYSREIIEGDSGKFSVTAKTADSVEIKNDTNQAMYKVALVYNNLLHEVGDLAAGEAREVQIGGNHASSGYSYYDFARQLFPHQRSSSQDDYIRERNMFSSFLDHVQSKRSVSQPSLVVGFSQDQEPLYEVNNKNVRTDNLTMWMQQLNYVITADKSFILPYGAVAPTIVQAPQNGINYVNSDGAELESGTYVFEFFPNQLNQAVYNKLEILLPTPDSVFTWFLWNGKENKWMELVAGKPVYEIAEPQKIMNAGNRFLIKLELAQSRFLSMPQIYLEGELVQ